MRILSIQPDSPFSGNSGVNIRNRAIVKALSEHGDVTVLAFDTPTQNDVGHGVEVLRIGGLNLRSLWISANPFRPLSFAFSQPALDQIADFVGMINPDIVIIEGVLLRGCIDVVKNAGVPVILDTHNVESALLPAILRGAPNKFWPGNFVRNLIKRASARSEEINTLAKADHVWACSVQDADVLSKMAKTDVHIVPNPIPNADLFTLPITQARYALADVVFTGHLGYLPNREAIGTLTTKIAPSLPQHSITIAGRAPDDRQRRDIELARAKLIDTPPEMFPILANASYTILPITSGGGTRIKVLEAMAAGILVIATNKAVENLGLVDGMHFIHAETPCAMLAALTRMQSAPEQAAEIAARAREFVNATHGNDAISAAVTNGLRTAEML